MTMKLAADRAARSARLAGYLVTALASAQLLFSGGVKIVLPPGAAEHFAELGWRLRDVRGLAVVELCCTLVYLVPRTAPLGAILLTGYLGGPTATHVRIGDGVFLYPFVLGVALWCGLVLRAPWLCQLLLGLVRGDRVVPGSARVDGDAETHSQGM
jgi:hypothetical protein